MKTMVKISVSLLLVISLASCAGSGYVTVSSRPEPPVYVRPAPPHPGYVWIDGDYYYSGGRYVYRQGYWTAPRGHRIWVSGSWQRHGNGWYWKKGHWRR